jgi:hypothetical protein
MFINTLVRFTVTVNSILGLDPEFVRVAFMLAM